MKKKAPSRKAIKAEIEALEELLKPECVYLWQTIKIKQAVNALRWVLGEGKKPSRLLDNA